MQPRPIDKQICGPTQNNAHHALTDLESVLLRCFFDERFGGGTDITSVIHGQVQPMLSLGAVPASQVVKLGKKIEWKNGTNKTSPHSAAPLFGSFLRSSVVFLGGALLKHGLNESLVNNIVHTHSTHHHHHHHHHHGSLRVAVKL
jgi:hypothetical protein